MRGNVMLRRSAEIPMDEYPGADSSGSAVGEVFWMSSFNAGEVLPSALHGASNDNTDRVTMPPHSVCFRRPIIIGVVAGLI